MAKKPDAARGKTTTAGKFKKMKKQLGDVLKKAGSNPSLLGSPKGSGRSPGAMGGRTKPKKSKAPTPEQFMRKRKILKASPMAATRAATGKKLGSLGRMTAKDKFLRTMTKGAAKGAAGVGLSKAASNLVKKLKPSGRPNVSDIKRAEKMLKSRKGK